MPDKNALGIEVVGKTTVGLAVKSTRALLALLKSVEVAVAKRHDPPSPINWEPTEVVLWDGKDRPEIRERVPECTDACAERIPHFADCEFPLAFHCRGCEKIVCWRHAGRTDLTGAWCESCAQPQDRPA